jgi:hypothetical protein
LQASGRLWKHARLRDIYGIVDQEQVEGYFTFTLVRNPWDRMVSYYHWLRAQSFDHPSVTLAKAVGFSAFLGDAGTQASLAGDGAAQYMRDARGVERCDLYLRLEHLAQDLPKLEAGIGIKLVDLPHTNRSERGGYREYYSATDREMVGRLFGDDVARFGYGF